MKQRIFTAFLPFLLAISIFCCFWVLPKNQGIIESCISPEMPLGYELTGWKGVKTQETDKERQILASDTRFSKANYQLLPRVPWLPPSPPINVSIIYSGRDLNNSIHRPEVCLPAQGHMNLKGATKELELSNGKTVKLTRLTSFCDIQTPAKLRLQYIHYYVFAGHNTIVHTHLARNFKDMLDRCLKGRVQSWAYFQVGTYWAPELGISEEDADGRLRKLISELLPRQIDWEKVK